jgi:hypothetical protein
LATAAGLALAAGGGPASADAASPLVPAGAGALRDLAERLARAPRRHAFETVPMILDDPEQWDHEALAELLAYGPVYKQVWDNTDIGGPWLNLMRNALNVQVWSFKHPDFLVVSMTHGTANLALFDQAAWDRYLLAKIAGERFRTNTLIERKAAQSADPAGYEDPRGAYSSDDDSIPALMARGAVFASCHMAIWELAGTLIRTGVNPDGADQDTLAASLTAHLIPGVVLTPGAVGTLPELQRAGFQYAK